MKVNKRKQIKVFLIVLIGLLTISIGYAAISNISLLVNSTRTVVSVNKNNFKVHFTEAKEITGTTGVDGTSIIESDDTVASFNVTGLSKTGDYAEAKYTVKNDSAGIGASIGLQVTNSNSEYFRITETIDDNKLQAGEETLATVKVEMIKTPTTDSVTTNITAQLIATPLEDESATGGSPASKVSDDPVSFATDSWATIQRAVQNNNTDVYNIGDTKTVEIYGEPFQVRLVNKTPDDHCEDKNEFGEYLYSQTACGFVVEFAEVIDVMEMSSSDNNYIMSRVYDYMNNLVYNDLSPDLQAAIKPTRVLYVGDYGNFEETTDNLYLLSNVEIYGTDLSGNNYRENEPLYPTVISNQLQTVTSHQLEYYSNNGVTYNTSTICSSVDDGCGTNLDKVVKQYHGSDQWYWLRSISKDDKYTFAFVRHDGVWGLRGINASSGVAPAFRIG